MHPGAVVGGKYRLDRLIGEGAMGAVWAAVHLESRQNYAVKVVSGPEVLADELCSRLLREARACSLIRHPNVVSVVDTGQLPDGAPFMVMQLLSGETLDVRLKRDGKLSPVEAARIGAQVARALAAAHAAGIVHRDLKPANIFLHVDHGASQSVAKVLDFGVSKIISERVHGPDARATATGHAMGSPAYMSPEQAKSANKVDARADVWSLGVVLFEMFAGQLPFPGETAYAVIGEVLHGPIPKLREVVPGLDPRLADLVARCIVRDVPARIQSAEEVVRGLENFLRDQSAPQALANERTEPLGNSRLRAAVLGSMRLGAVPDLDAPAPGIGAAASKTPATPAASKAPAPTPPPAPSPGLTPAPSVRGSNGSNAAMESFVRAPTARAITEVAAVPPGLGPPAVVSAPPVGPPSGPAPLYATGPQAAITGPQAAITGPHAAVGAPPPSAVNPHALGARSSTAPILLAPQSATATLIARPPPASTRPWIGIGAALGAIAVSLAVAIVVLVGGKPQSGSGSTNEAAASTQPSGSPTTPATADSTTSATTEPAAPQAATTTSAAPTDTPSATPSTAPSTKPTSSGKRPKIKSPRPGNGFPTNPG